MIQAVLILLALIMLAYLWKVAFFVISAALVFGAVGSFIGPTSMVVLGGLGLVFGLYGAINLCRDSNSHNVPTQTEPKLNAKKYSLANMPSGRDTVIVLIVSAVLAIGSGTYNANKRAEKQRIGVVSSIVSWASRGNLIWRITRWFKK